MATPREVSERLQHGIIPLALQQLDGVNRDHGGVGTNAIAVFAVDAAAMATLVLWADTHHYPNNWFFPGVLLIVSAALAIWTLFPVSPWTEGTHKWLTKIWIVKGLEPGFRLDAGPEVVRLLERVGGEPDPDAYATILAALVRSTERSNASLALRSTLVTVSVLLLPLDALVSWIYFQYL